MADSHSTTQNQNSQPSSSGFSISLGPKTNGASKRPGAATKSSTHNAFTNGTKRRAALSDDDEDDDGNDHDHRDKVQLVTGFGSSGAISLEAEEVVGPLVIRALKNKDWRAESKKKRGGYLPPEAMAARNGDAVDTREIINNEPMKVGLQFVEKSTITDAVTAIRQEKDTDMTDTNGDKSVSKPALPKTEDQLALEALLQDSTGVAKASTMTIAQISSYPPDTSQDYSLDMNEDDAYRHDVASRPPMATLDEYAAVPVEEFGAALLRGMGWKEGEAIGRNRGGESKARIVERRPAFLGLGAKGLGAEELGQWGKGDKKKGRPRIDKTYLPITLVDKSGNRVEDNDKAVVKRDVDEDWKGRDDKRDRNRDGDDSDDYSKRLKPRSKADYDDDRRRDADSSKYRERVKDSRDRDRDRDGDRDRDRRHDDDRYREQTKDRDIRKRDSDRDRVRDREKDKDGYKSRDSGRERDRTSRSYDDRDRDRDRSKRHRSRSRDKRR